MFLRDLDGPPVHHFIVVGSFVLPHFSIHLFPLMTDSLSFTEVGHHSGYSSNGPLDHSSKDRYQSPVHAPRAECKLPSFIPKETDSSSGPLKCWAYMAYFIPNSRMISCSSSTEVQGNGRERASPSLGQLISMLTCIQSTKLAKHLQFSLMPAAHSLCLRQVEQ